MPWVRLDDHFDEHPKLSRVGPLGMALWTAGLAYCNRNLTDGFIPWATARRLLPWEFAGPSEEDGSMKLYKVAVTCGMRGEDVDSDLVVDLLVSARLWDEVAGGYQVHDYDQYQPTKESVESEREQAKVRMQQARNKKRSSGEVRANKQRSSGNPDPDPDPDPLPSTPPPSRGKKDETKEVTDELLATLAKRHPSLDVHDQLERYRDWQASSGKTHKSQAAGFRNWLKTEEEKRPPPGSNGHMNGKTSMEFPMPDNWDCPRCTGGPTVGCEEHGKPAREPLDPRTLKPVGWQQ